LIHIDRVTNKFGQFSDGNSIDAIAPTTYAAALPTS
jgi:hypothetical protein